MGFGNVGLICTTGPELRTAAVEAMERQLRIPAADINVKWTARSTASGPFLALLQSTISTTAEDDFHSTSEVTSDQSAWIVADARLDNRAALSAALGVSTQNSTDEALILAAYRRWGKACGRHLRGDFAFILWDETRQIVLACRDPLGVRTLVYATEDDRVAVASTIAGVLSVLARKPKPNFEYLRMFLKGLGSRSPGPTAHESIYHVPPGHQLEVDRGTLSVKRYDELRPVRLAVHNPADVFAEFRTRLTAAVESRLRGKSPIGFTVSGGFDSSAILCLADAAVESGRCSSALRSYSAVFKRFKEADEGPYLNSVLASCPRVTATVLPWDDEPWSVARLDGRDGFPLEEPPRSARFFEVLLARHAARDGCRVLLRGAWADQLLISSAYEQPRLLWDLPIGKMAQEARHFLRGATAMSLFRSVAPGVLLRIRRLAAALGGAEAPERAPASMIRHRFVHGRDAALLAYASRTARWLGIEYRMPFLDRDLQEFVLSLPAEYFFEQGRWKRLLREGLRDDLPPEYQDRQHVAYIGRFVLAGMQAARDEIVAYLRSPLIVEIGLVSADGVRRLVNSLSGSATTAPIGPIQRMLAVEIWLRHQAL